jgi:hypothetical protein
MYEQTYNTSHTSDIRFMDLITIGFRRRRFQKPAKLFYLNNGFLFIYQTSKRKIAWLDRCCGVYSYSIVIGCFFFWPR